jgi:ubiquinone/menaquinone biosynthesis C-methylase UbiE
MSTVKNPLFARIYPRMQAGAAGRGETEHRRQLLERLSGRVVEVGAGPSTVTEVIAVEPEPRLREEAAAAAQDAPVPVRLVDGTADDVPLDDGSVDAAVVCLVLCSVPDQAQALAGIRRVIRPGGELRFYEHVMARREPLRTFLRVADATVWPHIGGGCHPTRDTAAAIEAAGFTVERCERFGFAPSALLPALPHVLGVARR